jgi:hypothetical protein
MDFAGQLFCLVGHGFSRDTKNPCDADAASPAQGVVKNTPHWVPLIIRSATGIHAKTKSFSMWSNAVPYGLHVKLGVLSNPPETEFPSLCAQSGPFVDIR